jgi:NitT/TauT family transport system permease protein
MRHVLGALRKTNHFLMPAYLVIVFLAVWQWLPTHGVVSPVFVTPLSGVFEAAAKLGALKVLLHIGISLRRMAVGFAISTALAMPVGFALAGAVPRLVKILMPLMTFLSTIPPFILFPIFMVLIGPGEKGIYLVIFWSAFWPILFTSMQGVGEIDARLIRAARAMSANSAHIFFKVVLPASFPNLMRGIRVGLTVSFLMLIGAETMGAESGLGWMINNAQHMAIVPRIYLGALLVAVIGFLLNFLMNLLESRVVDWKESAGLSELG